MFDENPLRPVVRVMSLPDYHLEEAVLDPHGISHVEPHISKVVSPCVIVKMKCGDRLICAGTPRDFVGMTFETMSKQQVQPAQNKI